jgi:hypothetical protein
MSDLERASFLNKIIDLLEQQLATQKAILAALPGPVTGITITQKETEMTTALKATYQATVAGSRAVAAPKKFAKGATLASFTITDVPGSPGNYLVNGTNAAGDLIDISAVATTAETSSDTTVATVASTGAATFAVQGIKVGTVTVTVTANWNDGSIGPFTAPVTFTVTAGGVTGLVVTPS